LAPTTLLGEVGEAWYPFVRGFWRVVADTWPDAFWNKADFKLQSTPGLRGLAQFGQRVFRQIRDVQDMRESTISSYFGDAKDVDWSTHGPFELATGKGGQRDVYRHLIRVYGDPYLGRR
jgi:hypothetical protein